MKRKIKQLLLVASFLILALSTLAVDAKSHHKHKHRKGKKKSVVSRSSIPQKPNTVQHNTRGAANGVKKSEETWHQNDKPQELTPETIKIVKKQESIKASELPGAFGDDVHVQPKASTANVASQREGVSKGKVTKAKKAVEKPTNPVEAISMVDKQDHGGRVPGAKLNHKKVHAKKGKKYVPYVVKDKSLSKIKSDKVEQLGDKMPSKNKSHRRKGKSKKKQSSLANAIVQKIVKLASASEQEDDAVDSAAKHVEHAPQRTADSLQNTQHTSPVLTAASKSPAPQVERKVSKVTKEKKKKIKDIAAEEGDDGPVRSLLDELAADEDDDEESGSAMSEISSGAEALAAANSMEKEDDLPDIECPWSCFYHTCHAYCPKRCCGNPYHCPEECSMFCTTRCPDKCCPPGMKKLPDVQLSFPMQAGKDSPMALAPPQPGPNVPQQQYQAPPYMSQQQVAQQASTQTGYPGYCPLFCPNVCVPSSCQPECCSQQSAQAPAESMPQMYYPPPAPQVPALPPAQYTAPAPAPPPAPMYVPPPQAPTSYAAPAPAYCPDVCSNACVSQCPNECCSSMGRR